MPALFDHRPFKIETNHVVVAGVEGNGGVECQFGLARISTFEQHVAMIDQTLEECGIIANAHRVVEQITIVRVQNHLLPAQIEIGAQCAHRDVEAVIRPFARRVGPRSVAISPLCATRRSVLRRKRRTQIARFE